MLGNMKIGTRILAASFVVVGIVAVALVLDLMMADSHIVVPLALVVAAVVAIGFAALGARDAQRYFTTLGDQLGRIASGDLPEPLTESRGEDYNHLRDGLNGVVESIRAVLTEMNRMSAEHEKGDIDVAMDEKHFQGDYRSMAQGVNAMVGAHIAVKKKAMAVFAEFGKGNFDAKLEQLPGKKRFINETVEQVRGNLKTLIAELNRMSGEHEQGDIDVAIDESRFQGDFRTMAKGVNAMVGAHIAVKRKAMAVLRRVRQGELRRQAGAAPRQEALHQRDRRAGPRQPAAR